MESIVNKKLILSITAVILVGTGSFFIYSTYFRSAGGETTTQDSTLCAEHGVDPALCPFCDPKLIEAKGVCQEHGVPEALCYQCNPGLIPGFKATDDWCKGHDVPESQCPL